MTPISAAQQFKAIAYLRWCLFKNSFRRKGGTGELVARVIVYPIFAGFIIGPLIASTTAAYFAVSTGHPGALAPIFWAVFAIRILVNLNVSQPALTFDPQSLIRYPLPFGRYLLVRIVLGLLSASTIICTLCLLGTAAGATYANAHLALAAFSAAIALAIADLFLIRMVLTWLDRWLATRRARELMIGIFVVFGLGVQYLNFTYNPGFNHGRAAHARTAHQIAQAQHFYGIAEPILNHLPPGLAAHAVQQAAADNPLAAMLNVLAILAFATFSISVFAWRMHREYRGENLSEANITPVQIPARTPEKGIVPVSRPVREELVPSAVSASPTYTLPPTVSAVLAKEWIYLRRNTAQFYGLLAPLAMVFLFTLRIGSRISSHDWLFPAAVAYSALGIAALAYNSLGLDAAGVQTYFLAPIRLGDVLLAKNLFGFGVNFVEILVIYALITYTAGAPPLLTVFATAVWLLFATFINATVGNRRSLSAPKKMDPSKLNRRQASQLSALISVGLMMLIAGFGFGLLILAIFTHQPWLPSVVLSVCAAAGFFFYRHNLQTIDAFAQTHRETILEELCKQE